MKAKLRLLVSGRGLGIESRVGLLPAIILLAAILSILAFAGGACTASEAELVLTLKTADDSAARQEAAADLARRYSLQATRDLAGAARSGATAGQGLTALREEYIAVLTSPQDRELSAETKTALLGTVDCLTAIGDTASIKAVGALVLASNSYMLDVRLQAVRDLGSLKDEAAVNELIEARPGSSGDGTISSAIDDALVQLGESASGALVAAMGQHDWVVDILGEIGVMATPAVIQGLDSGEAIVRYRAVEVLLRLYGQDEAARAFFVAKPELAVPLIEARSQAGYGDERDAAIEAILVQIGEPAVPLLIALLGKVDWVDGPLAQAGATAAVQLVQTVKGADSAARYRALSVLLGFYGSDQKAAEPFLAKPELAPALIEARSQAGYGDERDAAIEAILVQIGEPAVPLLIALLGKVDWVDGPLAQAGATAAVQLTQALKSTDPAVHYQALSALLGFYTQDQKAATPILVVPELAPQLIEARTEAAYGDERDVAIEAILLRIGKPAVTALVAKGASLLTDDADWTDSNVARAIYDLLLRSDTAIVINALIEKVTQDAKNRLHALFLAVKLGIPGSEDRLNQVLYDHGNKQMAEDYLNSGSAKLDEGGRRWASIHGYTVGSGGGSNRVSWGSF